MKEFTITISSIEANLILQAIEHISRMGISNEITRELANKIIEAQK